MGQALACGKIWTPSGLRYDDPSFKLSPGDRPPLAPSVYDDEFEDASIDPKWAWRNQGAVASIIEANSIQSLQFTLEAGVNVRMREQAIAVGDQDAWTIMAKFGMPSRPSAVATHYGFFVINSANGKLISYDVMLQVGQLQVNRWNSINSYNSTPLAAVAIYGASIFYLKLVYASANFTFYWSPDGVQWGELGTETLAAFLVTKADKFGFGMQTNEVTFTQFGTVHWFRASTP